MFYAEPVGRLIGELRKLPGIGAKTAQRLAFHVLSMPAEEVRKLSEALVTPRIRSDGARCAVTSPMWIHAGTAPTPLAIGLPCA